MDAALTVQMEPSPTVVRGITRHALMMHGVQNRPTIALLVKAIGHPSDATMLRVRLDGTTAIPMKSVATS
jgi:hypothetical protein